MSSIFPTFHLRDGGSVVFCYNSYSRLLCYSEFSADGKGRNYDAKRYPQMITPEEFDGFVAAAREFYKDKIASEEGVDFGVISGRKSRIA
jgi:hypothetical protein